MKLTIELIPNSAWGNNLRSYLTTTEWDKVRKKCYKQANYVCEICGGVGKRHPVECHERWEFEGNTIRLIGLIALCPNCHTVKHIGRAQAVGNFDQAYYHFKRVNNLTKNEADQYLKAVTELYKERCKIKDWELDVTYLEKYLNDV